MGTVNTSSRD